MIEAGWIYVVGETNLGTPQSEDLLFKVFCQDTTGVGVVLQWLWRPETVVMMAMRNPNEIVGVDTFGNTYTGDKLLHIIIQSRNNDYSKVSYT